MLLSTLSLKAQSDDAMAQFRKLAQVYQYLNKIYVDDVKMAPLVEKAITAMLEELDPHSAYIGAEEMKSVKASFDGEFSGIGVEFNILKDSVVVVNTIPGAPAERVGVLPNDRIVKIDTTSAVGFKKSDVPKYLRGKRGTKVAIDVVRHGTKDMLHFVIERDNIPINTVDAAYMATPDIGYIKVNRFGHTTMKEFSQAFLQLKKPSGLILDLRGNGGGVLEQAIDMAGFFLPPKATVVSTEGRAFPSTAYHSELANRYKGNLVVLIDEASASASEIVTGAIQDWDRGVVIGRQSFGKGLVQRQVMLEDGSAVRITMARYHTPSGRVIQRPYENGKREEYYLHHLRGYAENDSLAEKKVYKTLRNHRTVYGGCGITPDIQVQADTTGISDYFVKLFRQGVFNDFVAEYMDRQREHIREAYPDSEKYLNDYEVNDQTLQQLTRLASERGVEFDQKGFDEARELLQLRIKALFAQRLYGIETFYKVVNRHDKTGYARAIEILSDWKHKGAPLLLQSSNDKNE